MGMGDSLRAGIPYPYVTSQLGQLHFASFKHYYTKYQPWLAQTKAKM